MIIPPEELAADTLRSVIESFIMREGTDYGYEECSLSTKVEQVLSQVNSREILIVYDATSESVNLVTQQEYGLMAQ